MSINCSWKPNLNKTVSDYDSFVRRIENSHTYTTFVDPGKTITKSLTWAAILTDRLWETVTLLNVYGKMHTAFWKFKADNQVLWEMGKDTSKKKWPKAWLSKTKKDKLGSGSMTRAMILGLDPSKDYSAQDINKAIAEKIYDRFDKRVEASTDLSYFIVDWEVWHLEDDRNILKIIRWEIKEYVSKTSTWGDQDNQMTPFMKNFDPDAWSLISLLKTVAEKTYNEIAGDVDTFSSYLGGKPQPDWSVRPLSLKVQRNVLWYYSNRTETWFKWFLKAVIKTSMSLSTRSILLWYWIWWVFFWSGVIWLTALLGVWMLGTLPYITMIYKEIYSSRFKGKDINNIYKWLNLDDRFSMFNIWWSNTYSRFIGILNSFNITSIPDAFAQPAYGKYWVMKAMDAFMEDTWNYDMDIAKFKHRIMVDQNFANDVYSFAAWIALWLAGRHMETHGNISEDWLTASSLNVLSWRASVRYRAALKYLVNGSKVYYNILIHWLMFNDKEKIYNAYAYKDNNYDMSAMFSFMWHWFVIGSIIARAQPADDDEEETTLLWRFAQRFNLNRLQQTYALANTFDTTLVAGTVSHEARAFKNMIIYAIESAGFDLADPDVVEARNKIIKSFNDMWIDIDRQDILNRELARNNSAWIRRLATWLEIPIWFIQEYGKDLNDDTLWEKSYRALVDSLKRYATKQENYTSDFIKVNNWDQFVPMPHVTMMEFALTWKERMKDLTRLKWSTEMLVEDYLEVQSKSAPQMWMLWEHMYRSIPVLGSLVESVLSEGPNKFSIDFKKMGEDIDASPTLRDAFQYNIWTWVNSKVWAEIYGMIVYDKWLYGQMASKGEFQWLVYKNWWWADAESEYFDNELKKILPENLYNDYQAKARGKDNQGAYAQMAMAVLHWSLATWETANPEVVLARLMEQRAYDIAKASWVKNYWEFIRDKKNQWALQELHAKVFQEFAPVIRHVSADYWQKALLYALKEEKPQYDKLLKYSETGLLQWVDMKKIWPTDQALMAWWMIKQYHIATGNFDWAMLHNDLNNAYTAANLRWTLQDKFWEEKWSNLYNQYLVESINMVTDRLIEGGHTEQDAATLIVPSLVNNKEALNAYMKSTSVSDENKKITQNYLYGQYLSVNDIMQAAWVDETLMTRAFNMSGNNSRINEGNWMRSWFSSKNSYNNYNRVAPIFRNYLNLYDKDFNNAIDKYVQSTTRNGSKSYLSPQEQKYLNARAYYSKLVSSFPMNDLQVSRSGALQTKRLRTRKLKFAEPPKRNRVISSGRNQSILRQ